MKKKILCICSKGQNRSKYLAQYLKGKGYSTRYGGLELNKKFPGRQRFVTQDDVDWADILIIVRPRLRILFKERFRCKKKIITLNVTDSKKLIPEKFAKLKELSHSEFQKQWTRPQLRKAIRKYMPI